MHNKNVEWLEIFLEKKNRYLSSWLVEDDEQYSSATQFRTWTISVKPDKHANSIVLLELKTHNVYVLTNSNFGKVVIIMEYTKVVMIITAELSRAQSAHSGPPWITKFGYLCHRENLVMT